MNPESEKPSYPDQTQVNPTIYEQPTNFEASEDARISSPKYWLTVYAILVLIILLSLIDKKVKILSVVVFLGWLVVLVICYRNVSKLKASSTDSLTKEEKYKMVFFMSVDPVIAQAFFYYRLSKSLPKTAKIALKIGWKVFFLQIMAVIVVVLIIVVIFAIPALQKGSWSNTNLSQYKNTYSSIKSDYSGISNDFQAISSTPAANFQSTSLDPKLLSQTQTDCAKLKTDALSLKSLPVYPVSTTNTQLKSAANKLSQSATDCLTGLSQSSVSLLNQSTSELLQGTNDLASANKTIAY